MRILSTFFTLHKRTIPLVLLVCLIGGLYSIPQQTEAVNTIQIFTDDFNRAASTTVGNGWIDNPSTPRYSIVDNTLRGGGTSARFLLRPLSEAVQSTRVQATFKATSSPMSGTFGIATNYNGSNGYILQISSSVLGLRTLASNGGTSDLVTTSFSPTPLGEYVLTLDALSNGSSTVLTGTIASSTSSSTILASITTTNSSSLYQNIGQSMILNDRFATSVSRFTSYELIADLKATTTISSRTSSTVSFTSVVSGGAAPYTYRWDKGTTPNFATSSETFMSGQTSSSLTDTLPSRGNFNYYRQTITSADGQSTTTSVIGVGPADPFIFDRPLIIKRGQISFNQAISPVASSTNTFQQAYPIYADVSSIRVNFANTFSVYGGGIPQGEYSTLYNNELTLEAAAVVVNSSGVIVSGPTRLTFNGGQNSVTIPYTSGISTDPLHMSIESGQTLLIRSYVQAPSGGRIPYIEQSTLTFTNNNLKSGATHTASSSALLSTVADFSPGTGSFIFAPAGVYGTVTGSLPVPAFATNGLTLIGDSILEGSTSYGGRSAATSGVAYMNLGRAGEMGTTFAGLGGQIRKSILGGQPILFDEYGINDLRASRSFAQLKADKLALWTEFARIGGKRLITGTVTPLSNEAGGNNYTSTTTQTIHSNAAARASWNTYLRDGGAAADAQALGLQYFNVDVAATVEAGQNTSLWANNAGTPYTTDGVHPVTAGVDAIFNGIQSVFSTYVNLPWATITPNQSSIGKGTIDNVVIINGASTAWSAGNPGSPTFTLSGGSGASIVSQTISSSTQATLVINAGGSVGTLILRDPSSTATTSIEVVENPVVSTNNTSAVSGSGATAIYSEIIYGCQDSHAKNYQTFVSHVQSLCVFANDGKSTTISSSSVKLQFSTNLQFGMSHPDVKRLQQFLNAQGFTVATKGAGSVGKETTTFGFATKNALIKFQKAKKIYPTSGYFGPITRGVIRGL